MISRGATMIGIFETVLYTLLAGYGHASPQLGYASTEISFVQESTGHDVQVDWQAELARVRRQLARKPKSAFLHSQAAVAYNALGDSANFDHEINLAMNMDEGNPIYCYMAYAVYKQRHAKTQAVRVLDRALQIDPANPLGQYEKASILETNRKWSQALKHYELTDDLLKKVESDPANHMEDTWMYTDSRRNPYDLMPVIDNIKNDLDRMRERVRDQH